MAGVKRFEDLEIWQLARNLVRSLYEVSRKDPFAKDFGLKDQIRRSSVSVMNNISEGFESRTIKLFINYLGNSKSSCGETRSVLYVATDFNYISKEEFDELYEICVTISRKTSKFIDYLETYEADNRVDEVLVNYKL